MSDDTVVQMPTKLKSVGLSHPVSDTDRLRVVAVLNECADENPRPIAVVYKALAFMLSECADAQSLSLVRDPLDGGHDLVLAQFQAIRGLVTTVKATTLPAETTHYSLMGEEEMSVVIRRMFGQLHLNQCFSLHATYRLLSALIAHGAQLRNIRQEGNHLKIFTFTANVVERQCEVVVTIRLND